MCLFDLLFSVFPGLRQGLLQTGLDLGCSLALALSGEFVETRMRCFIILRTWCFSLILISIEQFFQLFFFFFQNNPDPHSSKNWATQSSRIYQSNISTLLCCIKLRHNKIFTSVSYTRHFVHHIVHHTQQFWTEYKISLSTSFLSAAYAIILITFAFFFVC